MWRRMERYIKILTTELGGGVERRMTGGKQDFIITTKKFNKDSYVLQNF